jgi:hypothetical protein
LDSKKIEREREHSFIKSALKGTDPGRKLESEVGEKEAAKRLGQVYQKKFGIEKEIAKLQEKDKILKGDGQITGAGLDQGDTDRLNELKKDLESLGNFFKRIEPKKEESPEETQKEESKKDETRKRNESSTDRELVPEKRRASEVFKEQEESPEETQKKEFILGVQDGIREEYAALSEEEKKVLKEQDPDYLEGVLQGVFDELSAISKEQLDELIKISTSLEKGGDSSPVSALDIPSKEIIADRIDLPAKKTPDLSAMIGKKSNKKKKQKGRQPYPRTSVSPIAVPELVPAVAGILPIAKEPEVVERDGMTVYGKIFDELSAISKEQLDELVKISTSLEKNKEDELEAKIKEPVKALEAKKEEGGFIKNLLGKGMDFLKSGLGSIGGLLGKLPALLVSGLGGIISSLGPALAVGAAGMAGYKAGEVLNDNVINPGIQKLTDGKSLSLGDGIYNGVQWARDALGMETDESRMKQAEIEARKVSDDKLLKNFESGQNVSPAQATILKNKGIVVPEERINKPEISRGEILSKEQLMRTEKKYTFSDIIDKSEEKPKNQENTSQTVVNAPTVVNNSSNTTNVIRQRVRNEEFSYNKLLDRSLVF